MMGCHAPSGVDEDDDREFLAAAMEDDALVANLLIRLSEAHVVVWGQPPGICKQPLEPAAGEAGGALAVPRPRRALSPKAGTWGRRRRRSTAAISTEGGSPGTKREGERRSSPATPLSWSGASGTSGSASEEGWSTPLRPPKRRKGTGIREHGGESSPPPSPSPPSAADPKTEAYGGEEQIRVPASVVVGVPAAAVGSPAGSGSAKAVVVAARVRAPPRATTHGEPVRLGSTGGDVSWAVIRRHGKKKTVPELRAMEESLLQEHKELQKELGNQKEMYQALLLENAALKKLQEISHYFIEYVDSNVLHRVFHGHICVASSYFLFLMITGKWQHLHQSSLPSLTTGKPTASDDIGEAKPEGSQHILCISERQALNGLGTVIVAHEEDEQPKCGESISCVPAFLFDLNCLPDGNL